MPLNPLCEIDPGGTGIGRPNAVFQPANAFCAGCDAGIVMGLEKSPVTAIGRIDQELDLKRADVETAKADVAVSGARLR